MANKKEIIRDQFITIKVSKEEKEVWNKYAEFLKTKSTRLARLTLMERATQNKIFKSIEKVAIEGLFKYAEITKDQELLERLKSD